MTPQHDVVGLFVVHPVHLPGPEQLGARLLRLGIGEGDTAGLFLQHDLANVGRIHRYPAVAGQEDLGAAVLRLADVTALAETLERSRVRASRPVNVAGGQAGRARETDVQRVDAGAT